MYRETSASYIGMRVSSIPDAALLSALPLPAKKWTDRLLLVLWLVGPGWKVVVNLTLETTDPYLRANLANSGGC